MPILYQITNTLTNDRYIGYTKFSAGHRFGQHKRSARRKTESYLHRAISKYGEDAFVCEVIEESDDAEYLWKVREAEVISELKPEYNMAPGGEGNSGHSGCKSVNQYTLDGTFIREYKSISDAGCDNELPLSGLYGACRRAADGLSSRSGGYLWSYGGGSVIVRKHSNEAAVKAAAIANTGRKRPDHALKISKILKDQRADMRVYEFEHKDGRSFVGTRDELKNTDPSISIVELGVMIRGRYKRHRGWGLKQDPILHD